jgi:uncharacterized damage-inducible protein DinB
MGLKEGLIAELKHESALTKKILERVPIDKKDWKPHEKSMSIGRLATHIGENTTWISRIVNADEFDFKQNQFTPHTAETQEELIGIFQKNLDAAITDLEKMAPGDFDKIWTVRVGDQVMYQLPKKAAIRGWAFSHMIHHRGQLSVFLRLLDVPVPGMYGPTADER